jgi:hypothetical protein
MIIFLLFVLLGVFGCMAGVLWSTEVLKGE